MNTALISLIIMGVCIIFFVTDVFPSATIALLGCVAMVVFGVCGIDVAFSGFVHSITILVFSMFIISSAILSSGAAKLIGAFVLRFAKNSERMVVLIVTTLSALLSAAIGNGAAVPMMLTICYGIVAAEKKYRLMNLAIPVAFGGIFGGACTLVGSAPQLSASGILQQITGTGLGMFTISKIGVPIAVLGILYVTLIGYPIGKRIWSNREEPEISGIGACAHQQVNKRKLYTALAIFALLIILFVVQLFDVAVSAAICALLCILTGTISQKDAFSDMKWDIVIWLASVMGLAKALTVSGATDLIADSVLGVLARNASPFIFFAAMTLLAMIISNFIANTTTVIILLPISIPLAAAVGLSPMALAMGITMGASLTFATPLANGFIGMTLSAGYRFRDYVRYGLLPSLLTYVALIGVTPLLFPLAG